MPRGSAQYCAAVVATEADEETRFLYPAAVRAAQIIDADARFQCRRCVRLLPHNPARHDLADKLVSHKRTRTAPAREFRLGYFSAHGAVERRNDGTQHERGLIDCENGSLFMDFQATDTRHATGRHFTSSILVMSACLLTGRLSDLLVTQPNEVKAVIGFQGTIQIGSDEKRRLWLGRRSDEYHTLFTEALVQPIRSLLDGRSAEEARSDAEALWIGLRDTVRIWHDRNGDIDPGNPSAF